MAARLAAPTRKIKVNSNEEHVLFHCPEYDTCRQEYPDLLLGNMSIKNISDFDNQETK